MVQCPVSRYGGRDLPGKSGGAAVGGWRSAGSRPSSPAGRAAALVAAILLATAGTGGLGSAPASAAPTNAASVPVAPGLLAAGNGHSCAVAAGGSVKCWGLNGDGELGDGTTTSASTAVPVTGLTGVRAVATGAYHSCALLAAGTVKCWGYNFHGELGDGTRSGPQSCARRSGSASQPCSMTPAAVRISGKVTAIAAGAYHSCALLSAGTVQCWGYDANGQLGDGTVKTSSVPVPVAGLGGVRAIAAGGATSCALLRAGTVKCWGNHYRSTPVAVSGLTGVSAIAVGYYHACAVTSAGAVRCWGNNAFGQLGDGTFTSSLRPVSVLGVGHADAIAAGEDHTCALSLSGAATCWGYDQWGQLGTRPNVTPATSCDGGAPCHPVPVVVQGLAGGIAIATGYKHTCARSASGSVTCWGLGGDGELGNRGHGSSYVPVEVIGL